MTVMKRFFGSGIMLATSTLATFAVFAQEPEEELLPAVDTSAAAIEAEADPLEPAVPSEVLAADVTRSTSGNQVMDRMELSRTEITGNQELPKVLYIVPWQKSDPGDLMGRPVNTNDLWGA